jgi:hypothetical protein
MNKKKIIIILLIIISIILGIIFYFQFFQKRKMQLLAPEITGKGIAMPYVYAEDLERTNSSWYYVWGPCWSSYPPGCVPMSWGGEDPNLPLDYSGYVLLFNEPDRPEQANITPENGVIIYKEFKLKYPQAKWVVGNVWYAQWLYTFRDLCVADPSCELPAIWGLHMYVGGIDHLPKMLAYIESAYKNLNGTFWITEFASVSGNISVDEGIVRFFESHPWIERWAYFCNRASGTEPWYPKSWNVQLFDWDTGEPTPIGNWYTNGLSRHFLPLVLYK